MNRRLILLCMLLAPASLSTQVRTNSAKSSDLLGDEKPQLTKALVGSGSLVEADTKTEFLLVPKRRDSSSQASATWTFGNKELAPEDSHLVEIQVGEYQEKPVFLPLRVSREASQDGVNDSIKLLSEAIDESPQILGQFKAQPCNHGRKCVKTCKDEKGKPFCCRYVCAGTPQ